MNMSLKRNEAQSNLLVVLPIIIILLGSCIALISVRLDTPGTPALASLYYGALAFQGFNSCQVARGGSTWGGGGEGVVLTKMSVNSPPCIVEPPKQK